MNNYTIVTNGKRYRIQIHQTARAEEYWEWVKENKCKSDGYGYFVYRVWETRFLWLAKRKLNKIIQKELEEEKKETWVPVKKDIKRIVEGTYIPPVNSRPPPKPPNLVYEEYEKET